MGSRRFPFVRVAFAVLWCQLYGEAQSATPPSIHYQVTVTRDAGLTLITFETPRGPADLYLPADLVTGEQFSGRLHLATIGGVGNFFAIEAAGQRTTTKDKGFAWRVPAPDASGGMTFILRSFPDAANDELARVNVPVITRAPITRPPLGSASGDFSVPQVGQSGAVFPIVGPFDGDSSHTVFTVHGIECEVLTGSTRQVMVRLPEGTAGLAPYVLKHDGVERRGRVRSVDIQTTYPTATGDRTRSELVIVMKGLSGLSENLGLRIDNRTPLLAEAGPPIVFVNPNDVRADGTYRLDRTITGRRSTNRPIEIAVSLFIPRSAEEEVAFILQVPRRDMSRRDEDEHADELRPFLPGVLGILSDFLPDPRTGWPAYRAMVVLDTDGAAPLIMDALPSMTGQQSGGAALVFYTQRVATNPTLPYRQRVHDTAVRILEHDTAPWTHGSPCCESRIPAIQALGLLGNEADLPLLELLYRQSDVRSAAEASLARLGSQSHIANIKAALDAPLPRRFTVEAAYEISAAIRSAGFSGRQELIPSVCRHLHTRGFADGDAILAQPANDAFDAILALVGHQMSPQEVAERCAG